MFIYFSKYSVSVSVCIEYVVVTGKQFLYNGRERRVVTFSKRKRQMKPKTFGDCVTINPVEKHKTNNSKCLNIPNSRTAPKCTLKIQNKFMTNTMYFILYLHKKKKNYCKVYFISCKCNKTKFLRWAVLLGSW
jgi:hypothetical protein